ncbi:3-isopropylmalate dehydratase small subunit [Rhodococcus sp. WB1]|uniref:3-isopropylmalate dehydratase small subunit n=1 Tax=Rhodococcus aetherivorans TaxID=191292 RepID=A0AA46SDU0_9NOCA|nr:MULTISPECIES: 3-isopropylmalate dehydratase small subunit [Rhodococcus]ANZ28421.1 3-isopropylmalate dehydratase small subunit [Rhodococcus sp. WB1]UYF94311.1 3-isopropylmalate dehydratase small subunit [Rhodococcus aetherivorans]
MDTFTEHTGTGAPLRISDVDTDQIIPARFCAGVTTDGLADALFADWRSNPDFVLEQPAYRDATVLVAGEDFGTGSSREWAVWALQGYGFRVVIAPRFGDIFRGNALKNGLLTVEVPQDVVDRIWKDLENHPEVPVTVDLVRLQISVGDTVYRFHLDEHTRGRLLHGYDDIGLTLVHAADIDAYECRRRPTLPTARRIDRQEARHG